MSRIICTATPKIKPARKIPRPATRFGAGILASHPFAGRMPYAAADLAWLAANQAADEDRRFDQMAGEALAIARHEIGLCF